MFVLHTSNRAEHLLEHLLKVLETPQQSVLGKEVFLIQSQGMERWLSQQIAERSRVWGNFEYLFPSRLFNTLSESLGYSLHEEAFSRDNLLWEFEKLLNEDIDDPVFQPLRNYLKQGSAARKRFQLAQQLANLYDQYQMMRVDWLKGWQRGDLVLTDNESGLVKITEQWQAELWRRLLERLHAQGAEAHRGERWQQTIQYLEKSKPGSLAAKLPERLSVFGINTLSPLSLAYLQALSRHTTVHFFLLNPCATFWAEHHASVRQQLRERVIETPSINLPLALLGQQGRDFQALLLDQQADAMEISSFDEAAAASASTLLEHVQRDVLSNEVGSSFDWDQARPDNSISVHSCHSKLREIEVLKDQLIDCFEKDPTLDLRDVVVMAPDIQSYLPFIEAVFSGVPDFPFAVADRSLRENSELLDVLLRFFSTSQGRFDWDQLIELLDESAVRQQFRLHDNDMENIRHWVSATRIRWGESGKHRSDLGLGEFDDNSWQQGLERLLMGYALNADQFCGDVLPYTDLEGNQAQALGSLCSFFDLLEQARKRLRKPQTLVGWLDSLRYFAEQLLVENREFSEDWSQLRELFSLLHEVSDKHQQKISLDVLVEYITSLAEEQKTATGFMRGQLTFCSMLPMRAIPFKVIALLGMDEGAFPHADNRPAFDLMVAEPSRGDRSRRADERYQFLEILISARQRLIISHVGQSIVDNEIIQPSIVVSELLDVLKQFYGISPELLHFKHPLHAFNVRYFNGQPSGVQAPLFSYSSSNCEVAKALQHNTSTESGSWWPDGTVIDIAEQDGESELQVVDVADLMLFFNDPAKYFVERNLGLRLSGIEEPIPASETFALNTLETYGLQHRLLEHVLESGEPLHQSMWLKRLRAEGSWPQGQRGQQRFAELAADIEGFAENINQLNLGTKLDATPIDLQIGKYTVRGELKGAREGGGLFYRYTSLKPKDSLKAWLSHLLWGQSCDVFGRHTYLMAKGEGSSQTFSFEPVESGYCQKYLLNMLDVWDQAHSGMSLLIPSAAFKWAEYEGDPKKKLSPEQVSLQALNKELETNGYLQLLLRGGAPETLLSDPRFAQAVEGIIKPLLQVRATYSDTQKASDSEAA